MIEFETTMHLLIFLGAIVAAPGLFRASKVFGRSLVKYFYPYTEVELVVEQEDGSFAKEIVKLSDSDVLVQKILKAKGRH
ncbi:hypothetical protein DDN23_03495 [Vibrio cholerae]|nr:MULTISPECIES: hypothetical protein [Vibrio]EGQ9324705.1 hypothetical protein [Vibrio cholerae]EGR1034996.1 hypothetical protein [Vibrio cholerae]EGR3976099.1 hypothetical protein [Vibrio cholerae]EGR4300694.1 hypothetical protein [Vibrio cholerae]EGR4501947.1 hypothetical protein [Vibrio cholerae]